MNKKFIFAILLILLFSISAVNAEEIDNTTNATYTVDNIDDYENNNIAVAEEQGNFTELLNLINSENTTIELNKNYINIENYSITLRSSKIINGNGHTLDGNNNKIFYILSKNFVLNNITFINGNSDYGGAISSYGNNLTITNCIFINNIASENGGAITGGNYNIINSTFRSNSASKNGGAIYSTSFGIISSCKFIKNDAIKEGGAIYTYFTNININNPIFENNSALGDGGAVWYREGKSNILNSTFKNNLANTGGALYWYDTELNIVNSTFIKNTAWERGGAIHCRGYNSKILNSKFINNSGLLAGAISLDSPNCFVNSSQFINNSVSRYGGAFWWYGINGVINNSYFENNIAKESGKSIYWSGGNGTIMNSFFNAKNTIDARDDVNLINLTEIGLPTIIQMNNITKYYNGYYTNIVVRLTDDNFNPLSYQTIKLNINNNTYYRTTNITGHALFDIALAAGIYNTSASMQYPKEYEDNIVNATILIKSTIISNDVFNDSKFFVKFLDKYGENLTTRHNVQFYVNNTYYSEKTIDKNGNIEVNFYLPEGKYAIEYKNPYTSERKVNYIEIFNRTIIQTDDFEKYFNGNERLNIELIKNDKTPIANTDIKITINGVTYKKTTNELGITSMGINLSPGVYNVTTEYNGMKVYSTVTVRSTMSGQNITKIYKNDTQYYATFRDSQGNYLPDGTDVNFNINGVFYTRKVSGNQGLARLNINLSPGEYILTAINPVNNEMSSNIVRVLPRIIDNKDLVKYYKNASQYRVKVLGDTGNVVGANEEIAFNINGVMYKRLTDASGYVQLSINLSPGTYIITAEYKGFMASNYITVLPTITASDLTKKYGETEAFEARVVDGQGKAVINQNVSFNINGVFYQRLTDDYGVTRLNINLNPGEYVITTSYNGFSTGNKVIVTRNPEKEYIYIDLPSYDTTTIQHIGDYEIEILQWRSPGLGELDIMVSDSSGDFVNKYDIESRVFDGTTWFGPYTGFPAATYHKWHFNPDVRITRVALKIKGLNW